MSDCVHYCCGVCQDSPTLDAVTVQTCAACPRYRSPGESVPAVNCSGDRARKKPCCDKCKKKHETHA